ncbi:MAG: glycosyltransferase [Clostridiales bacterium]|nr:glycosyltransferase [Clostridiales bacterium]
MTDDRDANPEESVKDMVSVIVPVYNVKEYLKQCLDSIAGQTYGKLEVILIDDGSTDGSDQICDEYCRCDSRFHVVRQENSGLGCARNKGLEIATGKYICFVDADDFIHPEYIFILLENLIMEQADLSVCSYRKFQSDLFQDGMRIGEYDQPLNKVEILHKEHLIRDIATTGAGNKSERMVVAWNKLMSRDWLGDFRFVNMLHEDEFMINEFILKCEKAVFTSAKLYYYRQRNQSIMSRDFSKNMRHLDALDAYEQRLTLFHSKSYKSVYGCLVNSFVDNCMILYHMLDSDWNHTCLKKLIYPRLVIQCIRGVYYLSGSKLKEIAVFLLSPDRHRAKYWSDYGSVGYDH